MKRIAFIRPNMFPGRASDAMTPLVFGLLAAQTPEEIETLLWDERLEDIPLDANVDLVAITVETYTARRAYQLASHYRSRGVPVVLGGYHPTFAPEEAAVYCDAVVIGDGEELWPKIIEDAKNGSLRKTYKAEGMAPINHCSVIDRRIFVGKKYSPVGLVQFGRGCRFNCEFCSIRAFYGRSIMTKEIDDVVSEIQGLPNQHFFFIDDNLFNDFERVKTLLRKLVGGRKTWSCQATVDIADDPELIKLLIESGCRAVLIGFESLDESNLSQMKKGWAIKRKSYGERLRILRDAGLMIYGTFVFGYDNDDPDVFKRTTEFAIENKFLLANFNPLTPMPGTQLFERLEREGRLIHDRWWLDETYRYGEATFHPRNMSASDLTEGCLWARKTFNTFGSISSRLMDPSANARSIKRIGFYLVTNLISRREIYSKQGKLLGDSSLKLSVEGAA